MGDPHNVKSTPGPAPANPVTPPMTPGGPVAIKPTTWPSVLGAISLGLGVLGILGGLWFAGSPLVAAWVQKRTGADAAVYAVAEGWEWWNVVSGVCMVLLAGWLGAVGVGLMRRRRWGVSAGRAWAAFKIGFATIAAMIGAVIALEQASQMSANSQGGPFGANWYKLFILIGLLLNLLWSVALPVFMLIWTGRATVKSEVAQWR